MSVKWEYLYLVVGEDGIVVTDDDASPTELENRSFDNDVLHSLGDLGWELCGIIPIAQWIDLGSGLGPVDVINTNQ